jgi:uncharacterized membrane protein YeaQ/YmgE (transglycosylase-associated protein family)
VAILAWAIGGIIAGIAAGLLLPGRFSGGIGGAAAGAALGAVIGGSTLAVLVDARSPTLDPASVVAASIGAAVVLVALLIAQYADAVEPKPTAPGRRRQR